MEETKKFKVLELFSGIGGIHYAFHVADLPHIVVAAVDINTVANEVYKHNFPDSRLLQRNIQFLTPEMVDNWAPDFITMSPPCQPFTRLGLKNDCKDRRTEPLLHIISLLKSLKKKPTFILLENVKGFENSEACARTIEALGACNYNVQQFLLSPKQLGVPNSRLRYYLLGKQKPLEFCFPSTLQILEAFPECVDNKATCGKIADYLESLDSFNNYLLTGPTLLKYGMILDIVNDNSTNSCCFTKGYVQYVEGTGSVLQSNSQVEMEETYRQVCALPDNDSRRIELLHRLELRYFTPREVGNLMCFPPKFCFPETITEKQRYRLLGNSVNVQVVSSLLKILLCNNKGHTFL